MATLERDLRGRKSPVHASVLCPGPINTDISRHSVTYRPSQRAKPKANSEAEGRAGASVQAALDQGMDPDEVGQHGARRRPRRPLLGVHPPVDGRSC